MKRLVFALLFPILVAIFSPAPAEARMSEKQVKRLYQKWKGRLESRKKSYLSASGRYLYWKRTLEDQKKQDAPREEIRKSRERTRDLAKVEKRRYQGIREARRKVDRLRKTLDRLQNQVHAGKGWGGSEGVADAAKRIAARMGIPVTSQKRTLAQTIAVGSTTASDHYVGNTTAFAVDFGVAGSRGDLLARRICATYGLSTSVIGTFTGTIIRVDGRSFRIQLLWRVTGHYDHVHIGIRRQ